MYLDNHDYYQYECSDGDSGGGYMQAGSVEVSCDGCDSDPACWN